MGHFCFIDHGYHKIEKAKKRPSWGRTRNPKRLEALAKAFGSAFQVDLVNGIKTFRRRMPGADKLLQAWMTGKWESISTLIPWNSLDGDLKHLVGKTADGYEKFGMIGAEAIPAPKRKELRYDYKNPRILQLAKRRIGENIVGPIKEDGIDNIRKIVMGQMKRGVSPRNMSKEIRNYVGLYPRLANAHANYVEGLYKTDLPQPRIDALAAKNYDRLLNYRAMTIARTETQHMLNRGQLEVWSQAQQQDLIPQDAEKVWIVDGDPCPECDEMDGETVPINEAWSTALGDVDVPSDIHPNCQCIMTLDF